MSSDAILPATGINVETIDQGGSGVTNATTASGNATLHFAATPSFVSNGMLIGDATAPTVIPANTTVLSFTSTTVVMSANASGAGVGSGDTITFSAQRQVVHVGSRSPAGFYSGIVSKTRQADTAVYAAMDVCHGLTSVGGGVWTFPNMAPTAGGLIRITRAVLRRDVAAIISGETSYLLKLYNVTPPSALVDNNAWDLPSGDRASYLGQINLGAPVDLGSTLYIDNFGDLGSYSLLGSNLFAYLVTVGGFTPTSASVADVELYAEPL